MPGRPAPTLPALSRYAALQLQAGCRRTHSVSLCTGRPFTSPVLSQHATADPAPCRGAIPLRNASPTGHPLPVGGCTPACHIPTPSVP